jgi:predicted N-formylglutamate amidohydrolase
MMKCIISCEHASNRVPPRFAHVFAGREKILSSHQAYDAGAANLARRLGRHFRSSPYLGSISRLLIDLNRSPTNKKSLYTPYSRKLEANERVLLLQKFYQPYREKVAEEIGRIVGKDRPVLHISLHSFSPVKGGKVRKADIGLLYDPDRTIEKDICRFLVRLLKEKTVTVRVRRNYPYLGKTDGFVSFLRGKYPARLYAGIEIELNQAFLSSGNKEKRQVENILTEGIRAILKCNDFSQLSKVL